MHYMKRVFLGVFLWHLSESAPQFIAINFPGELQGPRFEVGGRCVFGSKPGTCQELSNCPQVREDIEKGILSKSEVACRPNQELICCPPIARLVDSVKPIDIEPPTGVYDWCGQSWYGVQDLRTIYEGNDTVKEYQQLGYEVNITSVYLDQITAFTFNNGTTTGNWQWNPKRVTGGEDARKTLIAYMALLGSEGRWICDGVLINYQWVLSAAHCFDDQIPDQVRLGEYDFSNDTSTIYEHPIDYSIEKFVTYPEYSFPSTYHDLVLIKLHRRIPLLRKDLIPLCLPWGERASDNLVSQTVTLTGWGASIFFGPSTPVLQEANVTVLDSSKCDRSYSKLADYRSSFPNGINQRTSLCAGNEETGADACQGDSGGPIVYLDNENRFTLAGIVSTGNGCGLKEFPGIYVPMNTPKYLSWIKKVAFNDNP